MEKPRLDVICDTIDSFMHDYLPEFVQELSAEGYPVAFLTDMKRLNKSEVAFFISCSTILSDQQLAFHKHNVIIHPSKLPEGRGSGVVSQTIIEGANDVWVTLFEANSRLDMGDMYYQDCVILDGTELCDEIRRKQAELSFRLIRQFLADYPRLKRKPQGPKGRFFKKRYPKDSELDPDKSIREQFNLLRICDNSRYPAYFKLNGKTYVLKIYMDKNDEKQVEQ